MSALINGVALGLVCGAGIFVLTLWLVLKGGDEVGPHLALLGQYFIGYTVTWPGAFLGAVYGFLTGFTAGFGISWIYNKVAGLGRNR